MKLHAESHIDHSISPELLEFLLAKFAGRDSFFIETLELHPDFGTLPCALHGPAVGEPPVTDAEAFLQARPPRENLSRMCRRPPSQTRTITVIAGPHGVEPCILYTAFGGPLAPKEPGDPALREDERGASEKFWAQHALSF
jgi:hypothetical protein